MSDIDNKLSECTKEIVPVYKVDKDILRDFSKIFVAINYIQSVPDKIWKSKYPFQSVKATVQWFARLWKNSLPIPIFIGNRNITPSHLIGDFIFTHTSIPYPSPIYQIFPPKFGKNHIKFIEFFMTVMNNTICKSDFEFLLGFSDGLKNEESKKMFKEVEHRLMNTLYETYIAEAYREIKIYGKPSKKE